MPKGDKNYWPHAIVAMILGVVGLSGWTISVAIENPVEMDSSYMLDYHTVDSDINQILEKQLAFGERYTIECLNDILKPQDEVLKFKVVDKAGQPVDNAKFEILLTRPETTEFDKKIEDLTFKEGIYYSNPLSFEKKGRWNIICKVRVGDYEGYKEIKTFTSIN